MLLDLISCDKAVFQFEGYAHHVRILLCLQLETYYQQQMEMASALSGLHGYYSRMMNCLMDHINHQVGIGWRIHTSGNIGQMTVIVSGVGDAEPVIDGLVIGGKKH
jgi:hypothetical protein